MDDGIFILLFLSVSGDRHLNLVIQLCFDRHTVLAVEARRCVRTG